MQKRIECRVYGRVQMVMFRDFVTRKARNLNIAGRVRNEEDGSVSVVAEGEEAKLRALIAKLHRGSVLSRVDRVDLGWKEATGEFNDFRISYE